MRYRKSDEFQETEINWLKNKPANWDELKAKFLFKKMERPVRDEDDIITAFRDGEVTLRKNRRIEGFTNSVKEIGYQGIREGDLVIHEMDGFAGAIGVSDSDGKSSPVYTVCLPKEPLKADNNFYAYVLRNMALTGYISSLSQGIRQRSTDFRFNVFKEEILPIPPLPEQRAIAAFLDRKTEAIDAIIQKKEQLIERLKEKRQALITQAVTKGLDPNVPMKDSGIEWLGEIPEEWEIKRLKFLMETNPSKQEVSDLPDDFEISFLPMEKVGETGELILDETKELQKVFSGYTYFTDDDVTVAKITPCFENGKGALIKGLENGMGFGTTELTVFRPNPKKVLPEYLYYITISYPIRKIGKSFMYGAGGQKRVPDSFFENFKLGIPSIEKQKEIINDLNIELERLSRFRKKIREQIQKLNEYRQSLISAAVTGKIDVTDEVEIADREENTQTANIYFKRRVLAAKILDELHAEPTMGRRKLQKIVYLLEKEIETVELKGSYQKDAAGPFDNKMMRSIESQLEKAEWFKQVERDNGYGYKYIPMIKKEEYKEYYDRYWSSINDEIEGLIELVRAEKTDLLSLVATLYACWNDFLIKDEEFDGKKLIYESRHNWHEEKKEIPYEDWVEALNWMWNNGLKPEGEGELTREKS